MSGPFNRRKRQSKSERSDIESALDAMSPGWHAKTAARFRKEGAEADMLSALREIDQEEKRKQRAEQHLAEYDTEDPEDSEGFRGMFLGAISDSERDIEAWRNAYAEAHRRGNSTHYILTGEFGEDE